MRCPLTRSTVRQIGQDWTGLGVCAAFLTVWVVTNRVGRSVSWTILGELCALCAGVYFLVDLLACRRITLDSARLIYSRPLRRTIIIPVADITDAYPTDWQRSFSVNSGPADGVLIGTSTRRKPFRIPCEDPDYLCSLILQLSCSVTRTTAHPAAILQPRASSEDALVKVHVTLRGFITAMGFTIIGSIAAPVLTRLPDPQVDDRIRTVYWRHCRDIHYRSLGSPLLPADCPCRPSSNLPISPSPGDAAPSALTSPPSSPPSSSIHLLSPAP